MSRCIVRSYEGLWRIRVDVVQVPLRATVVAPVTAVSVGGDGGRAQNGYMQQEYTSEICALTVRTATTRDLPYVHATAARAINELLTDHYSVEQIRAAEEMKLHEVEAGLVEAGTYYVAEIDGVVVAGSGWSASGQLRSTADGSIAESGTAAMRATYVEPRWACRGIATLLARTTETAARLSGFRRFETMCSPAMAPLRRSLGYELVRYEQIQLGHGLSICLAVMRKQLA
jgi:GNAT superfamily N-acetyltransferase